MATPSAEGTAARGATGDTRQTAQFLWVGPGLSPIESMCLSSFVDIGYAVHLYAYAPLERVPAGVELKDAREILPESDIFTGAGAKGGSLAPFADRFRYTLLHRKGGWWFDCDFAAVALLPEPTDLWVSSEWDGPRGQRPNNGAIWCRPGDDRIGWMVEQCEAMLRSGQATEYTSIGPQLVTRMIDTFGAQDRVAPWYEFCPYQIYRMDRIAYETHRHFVRDKLKAAYHRAKEIAVPGFYGSRIRPGTRAVHLWNEVWRVEGMSKTARYHPGSLVGRLQARYPAAR